VVTVFRAAFLMVALSAQQGAVTNETQNQEPFLVFENGYDSHYSLENGVLALPAGPRYNQASGTRSS
jgi:hypothetical protein